MLEALFALIIVIDCAEPVVSAAIIKTVFGLLVKGAKSESSVNESVGKVLTWLSTQVGLSPAVACVALSFSLLPALLIQVVTIFEPSFTIEPASFAATQSIGLVAMLPGLVVIAMEPSTYKFDKSHEKPASNAGKTISSNEPEIVPSNKSKVVIASVMDSVTVSYTHLTLPTIYSV